MLTHGIPPGFRGGVHLFILNRHKPSVRSRVYRVTQLRTDGVHSRKSTGTGPLNLKVVPVTGAAFTVITMDQLICASLSHSHYWYEVGMHVESTGCIRHLIVGYRYPRGPGWCVCLLVA